MPIIGYGTWRVSSIFRIFRTIFEKDARIFGVWFEWTVKCCRHRHPPCFLFVLSSWALSFIESIFITKKNQAPDAEIETALELALEAGYRWDYLIDFCWWNYSWFALRVSSHAVTSTQHLCMRMSRSLDECWKDGSTVERWNAKICSSPPNYRWLVRFLLFFFFLVFYNANNCK